MLGAVTTSSTLIEGKEISATKARQLSIVNKVALLKELDKTVLETTQSYVQIPSGYLIGIKRFLYYGIKDLQHHLEYKNGAKF